jgi:hypothetical protein
MPSWGEFTQGRAQPTASDDTDFDDVCALALSGHAGADLLQALRRQYIERTENPLATEAALRVRVTQQQFVRDLENGPRPRPRRTQTQGRGGFQNHLIVRRALVEFWDAGQFPGP